MGVDFSDIIQSERGQYFKAYREVLADDPEVAAETFILRANALAEDIRCSELYQKYRDAIGKLKDDAELVKKVAFFKKENIKYRTKIFQQINVTFDEEKYVSSLYNELMLVEACREFLDSEAKILELISGVLNVISSSCELEFEIFE